MKAIILFRRKENSPDLLSVPKGYCETRVRVSDEEISCYLVLRAVQVETESIMDALDLADQYKREGEVLVNTLPVNCDD